MNFQSYTRDLAIESIEKLIRYCINDDESLKTMDVIDYMCSNGDLHLLMFINENPELYKNLKWGSSNMNWAAQCGKLNVVKWLHNNRTEGCTTDALDDASECGRFDVAKWLIENRKEGCTEKAVYHAIDIDMLEYIISNTNVEFSYDEAIRIANSMHLFERAKWLENRRIYYP